MNPRFYQASSSEMFGAAPPPQNEQTPFHPRSPYGVAKVAFLLGDGQLPRGVRHVRRNGILFNHESPRRGETFVTRKITRAVARIAAGLQDQLFLGNLDAQRDWGYAKDYVEAMWLMLQADEPDDFVIATGETHTVREAAEIAFARGGLSADDHLEIDPKYYRPSEVDVLLGDASKAKEKLGWEPKVRFKELIELMVDADVAALEDQMAGKVTRYSHEGRRRVTEASQSRLGYCKVCELEDFQDPELRDMIRDVFEPDREHFGKEFPKGREYRKYWEVAMTARAFRDLGVLGEEARVLGVGAGHEATIYWLTRQVGRVVATDLYEADDAWSETDSSAEMLTDPGRFWDGPWDPTASRSGA